MIICELPTTPMPGDAIRFIDETSPKPFCYSDIGVLNGTIGVPQKQYRVTFRMIATWWDKLSCFGDIKKVRVSGALTVSNISTSELFFTGVSCPVPSWWWQGILNPHENDRYKTAVPVWNWHGQRS